VWADYCSQAHASALFLLIYRTINSPFGEVLKSIRENEPHVISLGCKRRLDPTSRQAPGRWILKPISG
jgi:hypothetical protein